MQRRLFLGITATGIASVIAGCSNEPPATTNETTATEATTETATHTETETSTTTPEATTQESFETTTKTPEPTETETETPEPTPTPREKALAEIRRADIEVGAALDAYASYANKSNANWLDVNASTIAFRTSAARTAIREAREHLEKAEAFQADDLPELAQMVAVCEFIHTCTTVQDAVIDVFDNVVYIKNRLENERTDAVRTFSPTLEKSTDSADNLLQKLEQTATAADVAVSTSLTQSDFEAKISQFNAEIEMFEAFPEKYEPLLDGLDKYADARSAMGDGNYSTAISLGYAAENDFEDAEDEFTVDSPPSLTGEFDALAELAAEYAEKASDLASDATRKAKE